MDSLSKELSTAYILQIHKNPNQVNNFIKQILSTEQSDIYVHIDKKSYHLLHDKIFKNPRVTILRECVDVVWGDISQIDATLLLLREVLSSGKKYDFVCLRSGQDLLVKNGFGEHLKNNKYKIFMSAYYIGKRDAAASFVNVKWPKFTRQLIINPYHPYRLVRRIVALLYRLGLNLIPNSNKLPENYVIYEGSQWFCLPYNVAHFIIDFLENNKWFYKVFEESLVPDQFFFQTIIMNSKYKYDVVNDNLMYIKFGDDLKSRNNPITLKIEHIDTIKTSNQYFARKFDENVDNQVIEYYSNHVTI